MVAFVFLVFCGGFKITSLSWWLDMANDEVVNFDTMRDMVLNGGATKSKERFQFKWD